MTIDKILNLFRQCFAHYIKDYYKLHQLGKSTGDSNKAMDESLFVKIKGCKNWIIGAYNNRTGNIRVDIFNTRTENDMRLFINNNLKKNNNIITDGWPHIHF